LPDHQDTRARIDECLERAKLAGPHVRVVPLTGDASTRQYFRILRPDNPSVVLAVYEAPFEFNALPFVNVCELFTAIPLPVPTIAGHAGDLGILILEDHHATRRARCSLPPGGRVGVPHAAERRRAAVT
jgi:aminoglycoside/choline kinase family phosphotransferase